MKIIHIGLVGPFTENMTYQGNQLSDQNAKDRHNVTFIASCSKFYKGEIVYGLPEDYFMDNGVRLIRLEYIKILNSFISKKIRKVKNLYLLLEEIKPDVIFFHDIGTWEILSVAKYKEYHPSVKLYVDSHADANNSAKNFISKYFLHKLFYRAIFRKSLPSIDKVFYLSFECGEFLKSMYHVPKEKMEFYPLGGIIFSKEERHIKREKIRNSLELNDNQVLFIHSGKMDKYKRTADILKSFSKVKSDKIRLVIIGSMTMDVREAVEPLIEADFRVFFAGWKTADELLEYLCAADVYVQPGGQSATLQNAICCGCSIMIYPYKSHEPYLQGNGYYIVSVEDMMRVFQEIADDPSVLKMMGENSDKIARELLDYKKIAARLYE